MIGQIVSIGFSFILLMTLAFSKRLHFLIGGMTMTALGALPLMHDMKVIALDVTQYPAINFALYITVLIAAKDLFLQTVQEDSSILKVASFSLAITLLIISGIPTLYAMKVITFSLPNIPLYVYHGLYMISGMVLLFGTFILIKEHRFSSI